MRLTIINQYYAPDLAPTAQLAASLARHRAQRGDEVTVLTSGSSYVTAGEHEASTEEPDSLRVIRLSRHRGTASSIAARLWQYLSFYALATWRLQRLPRQDVIISMTTPPYIVWPCLWHKWRHRQTKVVLWNMDCYPDILEATRLIRPQGIIAGILAWLNRRLFRRLDHVVSLDEAMTDRLRRYVGAAVPITVIPNWEPLSAFPTARRGTAWQGLEELDLTGRLIVLYFGNAGWGHEFATVLEAAEQLRDEPVSFLFVGGGSKRAELMRAARIRGLTNLRFHHYVRGSEREAVLASADLALITLEDEAVGAMSPSKLHAGLAMGLPVLYVGPPRSNVDCAVEDFRCGVSLRCGDTSGLVTFVRGLLHDPGRLSELQHNARVAFEQAYCDEVTLVAFDRLIDSLCPAPGSGEEAQRQVAHTC